MSFNHERAWNELALPAFEALPFEMRELYVRLAVECAGFSQNPQTLDLPWPDHNLTMQSGSLRMCFSGINSARIAQASHVIYCYGHWSPHPAISTYENGAYWRFSNYADQVLRERCQLGRDTTFKKYGFEVHEGFLRLTHGTKDSWMWRDIGLATPMTYEKASLLLSEEPDRHTHDRLSGYVVDRLRTACLPVGHSFLPKFFDLSEFND